MFMKAMITNDSIQIYSCVRKQLCMHAFFCFNTCMAAIFKPITRKVDMFWHRVQEDSNGLNVFAEARNRLHDSAAASPRQSAIDRSLAGWSMPTSEPCRAILYDVSIGQLLEKLHECLYIYAFRLRRGT